MDRIFFNKNVLIVLVIAMACCYVAAAFYIPASMGTLGKVFLILVIGSFSAKDYSLAPR